MVDTGFLPCAVCFKNPRSLECWKLPFIESLYCVNLLWALDIFFFYPHPSQPPNEVGLVAAEGSEAQRGDVTCRSHTRLGKGSPGLTPNLVLLPPPSVWCAVRTRSSCTHSSQSSLAAAFEQALPRETSLLPPPGPAACTHFCLLSPTRRWSLEEGSTSDSRLHPTHAQPAQSQPGARQT